MAFCELEDIAAREVVPGCRARFVHSENMTISYWDLEAGAVLPPHSHAHEQITSLIRGEMELTVCGETKLMRPGGVAIIPPNGEHTAKATTECYVIDVFYPVREDYRGG